MLDEPNANLDALGETALSRAIKSARDDGSIVIVIAHRPNVISSMNTMLVMQNGRQKSFGRPQLARRAKPAKPVVSKERQEPAR